jgi:ABC-2 type transport system permease protein
MTYSSPWCPTMRKLWLVARREYLKCTRAKGFLLLTLGLPACLLVVVGISILVSLNSEQASTRVGYVDQAGVIGTVAEFGGAAGTGAESTPGTTRFVAYLNVTEAQPALSAGEIKALFVLPQDYVASGRVQAYYWTNRPSDKVLKTFTGLLRSSLVTGKPEDVRVRALDGPTDVVMRSLDGKGGDGAQRGAGFLVPMALGLFFMFSIMSTSGYLLQAVTDEKENRTAEVMATSVSANQLIGGKTAGLVAVALTQIFLWVAVLALGLAVGARFLEPLRQVHVSVTFLIAMVLFFVPSYILAAGIMVALGAVVTNFQQGQQISGALMILFLLPLFLLALVFGNPNSPVLVFFSLFPTTSFSMLAFRWGAAAIPLWQLIAGWLILVLSAAAVVVIAPRIFRRGMLGYGRHMSLRGVMEAVRSKGV